MQWKNGCRLTSLQKRSNMISYSYDETGFRTRKGMTGTQTWFDRDAAGNLVHETRNNGKDHLYYYYDASGSIGSISYNGVRYAFLKNLQHVANANPIRYRGYYYDTDTGWYYRKSRDLSMRMGLLGRMVLSWDMELGGRRIL